jgi:hypothetical protein
MIKYKYIPYQQKLVSRPVAVIDGETLIPFPCQEKVKGQAFTECIKANRVTPGHIWKTNSLKADITGLTRME